MSDSRSGASSSPPTNATEALARAGLHARRAAAEGVAALRALLDAASLGAMGQSAADTRAVATLARTLDELAAQLAGNGEEAAPIVDAVIAALDGEIARWEVRSRDDGDARAVLRAFIGLREILWEFGLRPSKAQQHEPRQPAPRRGSVDPEPRAQRKRGRKPRGGPRVQRVKIRG